MTEAMTFSDFFAQIQQKLAGLDVSGIQEDFAFQFNITGEEAGVFYVELKNGKLSVEPYAYHDRDAAITCSADTLRKLAEGKLDPILAFTIHKIKVEGRLEKALVLKQLLKG